VNRETRSNGALRRILWITLLSAAAASVHGWRAHGAIVGGAVVGAVNAGVLSWLELVVLDRWADARLRRLPFIAFLGLRVAIYLVVVLAIAAVSLPLLNVEVRGLTIDRDDVFFAFSVCLAANVLLAIDQLLGSGALIAFVAGRYRRPRREERIILYLDLRGSTAIAERLGEERFLDLLNAFFADVTEPIEREGGEVHKYVGDEVIAAWPATADAALPIEACFAAAERIEEQAEVYRRAFGLVPGFRAAIHAGPVVIGELGARKKEIALIGDAMNTAARILEAARDTGADVLVSTAVFDLLRAPAEVGARRLAPIPVRGKAAPLQLVALTRATLSAAPAEAVRA
jgi:adenylate cyclase